MATFLIIVMLIACFTAIWKEAMGFGFLALTLITTSNIFSSIFIAIVIYITCIFLERTFKNEL